MNGLKYAYRVLEGERTVCCGGIEACAGAIGAEAQYMRLLISGKRPDSPYRVETVDVETAERWIADKRAEAQEAKRKDAEAAARKRAKGDAEKREAAERAMRRRLDCKGCRYWLRVAGTVGMSFCDRYLQTGIKPEIGTDGRCKNRAARKRKA